jgi:CheY-like chemotaxis protein
MSQLVLIVEDDLNDRTLLEHAFRKAAPQLQLRLAKDAFQAEDYLLGREPYGDRREHPLPSVLLLDLKMPRRSGLEFLAWMREQPQIGEIPVIVLSSSQESSDIDRAYELGARSYLVKSVDLRELMSVVQGLGTLVTLMREI